jgi:hypothetical protein
MVKLAITINCPMALDHHLHNHSELQRQYHTGPHHRQEVD